MTGREMSKKIQISSNKFISLNISSKDKSSEAHDVSPVAMYTFYNWHCKGSNKIGKIGNHKD